VLDAVAESAARLTATLDVAVFLRDGDGLRLAAHHGPIPVRSAVPLIREEVTGRAVLDGRTVHVADLQSETVEYPGGSGNARRLGLRTVLSVPLLREGGIALGTINLRRAEVRLFTERQVALLKTFADQAVIAIENVRLFTELQEKNRALTQAHAQVTESLEQQTATSEVLKVISRSVFDLQPVLETLIENATRLAVAEGGLLARFDGEVFRILAGYGASPEVREYWQRNVIRPGRGAPIGRAALERQTVHIVDLLADPEYELHEAQRVHGGRSVLVVPMLRQDDLLGVFFIYRTEVRPFTDKQIGLVATFADQAVIAIENVRLFTELQASNRELTTALDKQTATSDILSVISRSQTNIQPVFDAIVHSAVRLLGGYTGGLTRVEGDQIVLVALTSVDASADAAVRATFPDSLQSANPHARAVRERMPLNIADAHTDSRLSEATRAYSRTRRFQSWALVPLLRQAEAIGGIGVTRRAAGGFTDDEIALLKTFADQAVIAIENSRLLSELQARTQELTRSVGELRALGEVSQAVSSTLDLGNVLETIVSRAVQLSGSDQGIVYEFDEGSQIFHARATHRITPKHLETVQTAPIRLGEGAIGRAGVIREPVQVVDTQEEGQLVAPQVRELLLREGMRSLLAVPLVREQRLLGGLVILRREPGAFATDVVDVLQTFATQSVLAIQNARLFRQLADKSRQLEVASQHKSEFLANMSHELRTPLNAIIGFSEVLSERMFGELNEKQAEYLKDIYASGTHLLSLINDILDLSKIEAGRMELELTEFDLPTAIENALMLVRERAGRRSIALHTNIDNRLGQIQADERKVRQVVLNLLSNAIKFTPEGGRIEVLAAPKDGLVEVSVTDTGVGIAPEDQEAVFEEFRQVGTADKKVEGTGLGLTLCRKFIELHGGKIWVTSQVGVGSTFTFTIPVSST
jgi:two-component system, NtrC family, sensor kinase